MLETMIRLHLNLRGFLLLSVLAWLSTIVPGGTLQAGDWMTWPSTYTHDGWGNRVDQHTLAVQPVGPSRNAVVRSGFRHTRSTLQAGNSADNYHVTEQWGAPVVPYEHWRFPYRPFGVPYDAWGPQMPLNWFQSNNFGFAPPFNTWGATPFPSWGNFQSAFGSCRGNCGRQPGFPTGSGFGQGHGFGPGFGFGHDFGPGFGNRFGPGFGQGLGSGQFPLQPQYWNQPWFDGTYPEAPPLGR